MSTNNNGGFTDDRDQSDDTTLKATINLIILQESEGEFERNMTSWVVTNELESRFLPTYYL